MLENETWHQVFASVDGGAKGGGVAAGALRLARRFNPQNPATTKTAIGSHGVMATAPIASPWPVFASASHDLPHVVVARSPNVGTSFGFGGSSGLYFCFSRKWTVQVVRSVKFFQSRS